MEVNQLASPERWVLTTGKESADDTVGAGTFIYSYNHQETAITTTADTTLNDLVGLINNDANNPGVTADLLQYNGTYHLLLNGKDAGSDYAISINPSNTEVWKASSALTKGTGNAALTDKLVDLSQFNGTLAGGESITISGQKHDGTAVSQTLSITKNTTVNQLLQKINDAFGGTATATLENGEIQLTDNTCGTSQMTLSLTYNAGSGTHNAQLAGAGRIGAGGSTAANLAGFAAADFTKTQSAQDSQFKVDGYPPGDSEWISRSSNDIDDVIHGVTLHLHDTGTAQIDLTRDTTSLKSNLNSIISAYNAVVSLYQKDTGYDTDTNVAGPLLGDSVVADVADNLRMPLLEIARGFVSGGDTYLTAGQIGLQLDDQGQLSLDSSTFDDAVTNNYADVLNLIGANKTGSSDSNTISFYGASSDYTTAGTYNVQVTVAGGIITSAKIKSADDTDYRNASVQGNTITGDSTFDANGNPVHPENGLQLSVDTSQDGTFTATVQVKQGFAGAMEDTLTRMLDSTTGALPVDYQSMGDQIQHLNDQITNEQNRLNQEQSDLETKFANLESTLALLQGQMAALGYSTSSSSSGSSSSSSSSSLA